MNPQTTPARSFPGFVRFLVNTDPGRLLAAWLLLRSAGWVLFSVVFLPNPPLDLVEWLSWGGTWEWGYPKHPPLPAWVADLSARVLSPGDVWGVYIVGYVAAGSCLWAVWLVARDYLPARVALLAALALDGLSYLTYDPAEFSNNIMLDAGWAWTVVCFHRAFRTGAIRWWLAVGLVVGLSLLCKYTIGVLLVAVAAYVVVVPAARRCLLTPGPYLAAAVAAAVVAPHAIWLIEHDFVTLGYAAERSAGGRGWVGHLVNPVLFLAGQAPLLLPLGFVVLPLLRGRTVEETTPDRRFLHAAVLGPLAVLLLISVTTGCQLRQIWGSPLWTFLPLWAVATFGERRGSSPPCRGAALRWAVVAAGFVAAGFVRYVGEPYTTGKPGRTQFPGKELAAEVGRRWDAKYPTPFPIAAGEGWRAGVVCCFAPHRPVLYSSGSMGYLVFEPQHCPWTGDEDLNARGGVVVWDYDQLGDTAVVYLRTRFPRVELQPPVELTAHTWAKVPPVRVGLAFVPPRVTKAHP